ncbi:MAG: FN3 associated domain-containing protein [Bacteroidales bacterium]|nr:chitobiase/beta-hexosaminidase C-terminal domain-containing protein [Lentimicrobiaceae bacterium]MDD5694631.1 FN3 associated domain-containing protein [Bacteroidales bacterium]
MKPHFPFSIISLFILSMQLNAGNDGFKAISRLSYYTMETSGHVLVVVPDVFRSENVSIDLMHHGRSLVKGYLVQKDITAELVPFRLQNFREGEDTLLCIFNLKEKPLDSATVEIRRLPWKSNEVKIDHFSGGLQVDGMPFFPFGFYCRTPVSATLPEEEVVKGFNMISPYQRIGEKTIGERKAYMDRCAVLGMKVHYQLLSVAGGGGVKDARDNETSMEERKQMLTDEVLAFRDHPALLAWYIADEPDGQDVPPENLADTYRTIRELDPYHPITIVLMTPSKAMEYKDVCDIVMADPYPVPNSPVTEVAEWAGMLYDAFYPEKPVWIVPQAFGGAEWWKREPTQREIRVMTYLAIVNHASGIQYFIRHGLNRFPKSQAMWAECGSIALEVADLTPYFYYANNYLSLIASTKDIQAGAWVQEGETLVIAVNTNPAPLTYEIKLDQIPASGEADVLYENRKIVLNKGVLKDIIDGYGTRVYKITTDALSDPADNIHPFNLTVDPGFEENQEPGIPSACYAGREGDRGATYFTDSRTSYQGYRSLKLVTPENDQGVQLSFYPVQLRTGQTYSCSVWAKAGKEIRIEEKKSFFRKLSFKKKQPANLMQFRMSLGDASKVFDLDGEWRHYSFVVPAVSEWKLIHLNPAIELISRGTAWFDLLEVIPDIIIQSRTIPGEKGLQVELSSPREVDEIRYTLDETVPDTLSGIYTGPFMIGESCILKAAVFIDGKQDGYTESEMLVHKGTGMSLEYTNSYSSLYTGGGELALLDGKRGTTHYKDGSWQGFLKKDMEVTINLGSIMPVNKVTAGFLQDQGVWIFLPLEVTFSLSLDGSDEVKSTTISNKSAASQGSRLVMDYTASFDGIQAQFIRIKARSPGLCPPWHKGSGKPAWIFSDEVIIE